MLMKTRYLRVSEFAEIYSGGTPSTGNPDYWDGDVAWVTPKDLSAGTGVYIGHGERFITEQGLSRSSARLLPADTVILSSRAPVGYVAIAKSPLATNQGCKNLRCKNGVAHPLYVYYLLKNSTSVLESHATGSTYKELSSSRLKNITFPLPENIADQVVIASILNVYDRAIENNRRRIALLEKAAQLIYKEWFVRFRFPGHEQVPFVQSLPRDWQNARLSEVAHITMGQSPKSTYYNDTGEGLPFHQGVTDFGERFTTDRVYCRVKHRLAWPGDILFSVRAPVGRINVTLRSIVIGRGLAAIRSRRNHQSFLFYALKSRFFKEDMMGRGTIFAAITRQDLSNVELVVPPERILNLFVHHVGRLDRQIETLHRSNNLLKQARDALLRLFYGGHVELSRMFSFNPNQERAAQSPAVRHVPPHGYGGADRERHSAHSPGVPRLRGRGAADRGLRELGDHDLPAAGSAAGGRQRDRDGRDLSRPGSAKAPSRHQVHILRNCLASKSIREIMALAGRRDRTKFRHQVMQPLLADGWLAMTIPDKPTSSRQRYRLTAAGRQLLDEIRAVE